MSPTTRGITDVLGYLLSLSIVLIIIGGLGATGFVVLDSTNEISANATLASVGQTTAADIEQTDRTVRAGRADVTKRISLPTKVEGEAYRVAILNDTDAGTEAYRYGTQCQGQCLVLYTETGESIQTTPLRTEVPINSTVFDARSAQVVIANGTLQVAPIGTDS